jgi:peptidoglycan/xylan/chitin deacetylase (PgdA/CDA1 family)
VLSLAVTLPASAAAFVSAGDRSWSGQSRPPLVANRAAVLSGTSSDTTPPTTVASGYEPSWHNSAVRVTLTATDNAGGSGVRSITYSIDGGASTTVDAAVAQVTIEALADHSNDGIHVIAFHATDNALNVETPNKTTTVKIDTAPPTTTAKGAGNRWHRKPVTLIFTASDDSNGSGYALTEYSRDGGATWIGGTAVKIAAPANHSRDGLHEILYRSLDNAGNYEGVQSVAVKIDTRRPVIHWLSVKPALVRSLRTVQYRFRIRESSATVAVSLKVYDQYGTRILRRGGLRYHPGRRRLNLVPRYAKKRPFPPGLYRLRLTVTDRARNRTDSTSQAFRNEVPAKAQVLRHVSGAGRRVALTFDDGFNATAWRSILGTLKAFDERATFFVTGNAVASAPALARRTVANGNAIGSHGYTHTVLPSLGYGGTRSELLRSEAVWWSVAGVTPLPYLRPPEGAYNATSLAAAGSLGFRKVMLWDVDPWDWSGISSSEVARRVLSSVHPGAVVVLHILANTAAALPTILRGLRARHYEQATLPEMFQAASRGGR